LQLIQTENREKKPEELCMGTWYFVTIYFDDNTKKEYSFGPDSTLYDGSKKYIIFPSTSFSLIYSKLQ
jgi:hypothetical protein